jgi:hypothetical protein
MVTLRRLSAAFARAAAIAFYRLSVPTEFTASPNTSSLSTSSASALSSTDAAAPSKRMKRRDGKRIAGNNTRQMTPLTLTSTTVSRTTSSRRRLDAISAKNDSLVRLNSSLPLSERKSSFRGLRIVFYTRGSSGKGRSMQNEVLLVRYLVERGAFVVFCCDFSSVALDQQLAYAAHADVVRKECHAMSMHRRYMCRHAINTRSSVSTARQSSTGFS